MTDPATLLTQLNASLARRDRAAVNGACRAILKARPAIGSQWRAIAMVLLENGELTDARRAIDLLVSASRNSPLARFVQAEIYARSGRVKQAQTILRSLPSDIPDPLGNAYMRGTTAMNLGDLAEAREQLLRAVTLAPHSGQSWLALAMLGRVPPEDGGRMEALQARMTAAPVAERGPFFYALGKFRAEQGDADGAFAAFANGAAAEARARPPAPPLDTAATVAAWGGAALDALSQAGSGSGRPIFVTGLPRSGTTLVEQILTAHSQVDGGEELSIFRHLLGELGGAGAATTHAALAAGRGDALVALYDHLVSERFPGRGRVVDKTLLASRYMGPLVALFPDAPIVWLRRDPLDNAWSIFRTYFRSQLGWTFDLRAIAAEMLAEDVLFAHWSAVRPRQILPIDYAELVRDPEQVVPRIAAHCGLTLEPQQLRPHESARTVVTASVAQVRRPINRDALGAAAPYRRHLQPFIDAYRAGGGTIA